jgi:hypothetical protein
MPRSGSSERSSAGGAPARPALWDACAWHSCRARVDDLAGRNWVLDGTVALHTAADDGAVEHAERGEQGGDAVPFVVVCDGMPAAWFDRQSGLGAVERLDLTLFVDRQDHGMGRRIDIKPDAAPLGGRTNRSRTGCGPSSARAIPALPPSSLTLRRTQRDADRKPRCVVAKVEWHPGELYPRVSVPQLRRQHRLSLAPCPRLQPSSSR